MVNQEEKDWRDVVKDPIVRDILKDLTDRRGLKQEWWNIDFEIQCEIIKTWESIVKHHNKEVRRCPYEADQVQCCLELGHDGSHKFKCASKHCPGYTWRTSQRPHPPKTCY